MELIRNAQLALAIVVSMGPAVVNGQEIFEGDWRGKLVIVEDSTKASIRIVIEGNDAKNYYCIEGQWKSYKGIEVRQFKKLETNALLIWIDKGKGWTETQTFSLTNVNKDKMALAWTRHVNNKNQVGEKTWHSFGHGTLERVPSKSTRECD